MEPVEVMEGSTIIFQNSSGIRHLGHCSTHREGIKFHQISQTPELCFENSITFICLISMDSSKTGELHQQATCYVYVLRLRSILLKLSTEKVPFRSGCMCGGHIHSDVNSARTLLDQRGQQRARTRMRGNMRADKRYCRAADHFNARRATEEETQARDNRDAHNAPTRPS